METARQEAFRGKVYVAQVEGSLGDTIRRADRDLSDAIKTLIRPTALTEQREAASAIVSANLEPEVVALYKDGSAVSQLDVQVRIKDNRGQLLFSSKFPGERPKAPSSIYKMANASSQTTCGPVPTAGVVRYLEDIFRRYDLCPPPPMLTGLPSSRA
jgi:hypothetical protein